MGALPRPDVPPGGQRDLVDALHDLHHRAGWPSLRVLARQAGCSHTTVSAAFSSPRLPSWGTLELLVEAMGGDTDRFHDLWLDASTPNGHRPAPVARIAGRRDELAVVRRHLETGTGLLLVTGEAGIGKTALVRCAGDSADTFIATGACLPLSVEVPLLPIADALRSIHEHDDGQWFKDALTDCPPYVAGALSRLLPELSGDTGADLPVAGSMHHLFSAITTALARLSELRPLAVLVEDLHWADGATLDLVEQLAAHPRATRLVGTWRLDDPATPPQKLDWFTRTGRSRGTRSIELVPLTVEETAEQLRLVSGDVHDGDQVASLHARSAGLPLFTEHLATQAGDDDLPRLLVDLLDRRLGVLTGGEWVTARALGLADRGLGDDVLRRSTGLSPDALATACHELHRRRLISSDGSEVRLSHPLLADAVRRRVMPGEAAEVHRHLATALATSPDSSAAEVAAHWQAAGDAAREAEWRVAAARDSAERYDHSQEAEHWLRVLALWPHGARTCGHPPVDRPTAYLAAMDALNHALQWGRAAEMSDAAWTELGEVDDPTRAELLRRASDYRGDREGMAVATALIDEALDIYRRLPPGNGLLRALSHKRFLLMHLGQYEQAEALAASAADIAAALGDRRMQRHHLISLAWHRGAGGDLAGAFTLLEAARALAPEGSDPLGDIRQAVNATDLLLLCGAGLDELEAVARPGLETARSWGIDNEAVLMLLGNLATGRLRNGQVSEAAALIPVEPDEPADPDRWPVHQVRAVIEARSGRLEEAARRSDVLWREVGSTDEVDLEFLCALAEVHFWRGTPDDALARLLHDLDLVVDTAPVRTVCDALLMAARIGAELAGTPRGDPAWLEVLRDLRSRAGAELRTDTHDPQLRAHATAIEAELARLGGQERAEHWLRAAAAWDRLARPHDAAYCRWHAAQVAIADGRAAAAAKLLRRATRDAREHVPLLRAIEDTAAGAFGARTRSSGPVERGVP